jgi:hypothetical protein
MSEQNRIRVMIVDDHTVDNEILFPEPREEIL